MIGKGKAISHTKASIEYGWNQEKDAEIVFKQNLAGETPNEVTQEFKIIQSMNEKCNRNTFSFVISPTIEDGKKVSLKQLNIITKEFINNLKLNEHQAIAFIHQDKAHKHIHLYVNRIGFDGKAYKDNFIGKRSQKTAEIVAEKLGLQTVKQVQTLKLENLKDIRKYIKQKHEVSFNFFHPENHSKYIDKMKEFDISVKPVISKSNKLQGFRYQFKNTNLKGSEVHRSLSINKLNSLYLETAKTIIKQVSNGI
ncbi:mobilization protein BmgA [Tenacibaculum sp. KUL113]|nr:mobilization protein BmgA [Tenacibaculum sp. KUL113]